MKQGGEPFRTIIIIITLHTGGANEIFFAVWVIISYMRLFLLLSTTTCSSSLICVRMNVSVCLLRLKIIALGLHLACFHISELNGWLDGWQWICMLASLNNNPTSICELTEKKLFLSLLLSHYKGSRRGWFFWVSPNYTSTECKMYLSGPYKESMHNTHTHMQSL